MNVLLCFLIDTLPEFSRGENGKNNLLQVIRRMNKKEKQQGG